ncbi:MAG: Ig-like domain-containing protein [Verrucomicrobiota bacterium]
MHANQIKATRSSLTRSLTLQKPIVIAAFILAGLLLGSLTAKATTYYSAYGASRTWNITSASGASHAFQVDGIAQYKWTEWYVNGVYTGTAQNDYSGILANDPEYTYTFSSGTTVIKALVYNSDFSVLHESHVWNVTVDVTGPTTPGTPDLNSGDDSGSSSTDNITRYTSGLTFSWTASTDSGTGVAGYEWKLDSGTYTSIGNTTSTDISAAAGSHTFYVRAKDNAGNYGSASSLAFTVDTTAPSVPTLVSPSNGSSTSDQTPTFDWNDSTDSGGAGLYQYEVEIYDGDITWGDISTTTTSSTYTPSSNIELDTIYWKIRAVDKAGNISSYSTEWSVDIVDTTAPTTPGTPDLSSGDDSGYSSTDNITRYTSGLTFSWSASTDGGSGMSGYEWRLDSGAWNSIGNTTSTDITAGEGAHTFYVRAKDNSGNYSSASSLAFTVDATAPSVPTLVSPANGSSTGDQTPTFDWNDSTDASSGLYQYEVEVYDFDITWGDISTTTTVSTFTPGTDIPFDTVYWKIRAVDRAGNVSAYSTEWSLNIIDNVAPTTPGTPDLNSGDDTGYSNTDNITKNTSGLTFAWSASTDSGTGISGYEWRLDAGSWTSVGNTTSTDISAGEGAHTFYVRAKDNANNYSSSSSLAFTVDATAPSVPSLISPANGGTTGDQTPTFDWSDSSDASSGFYQYEVEIYDGDITWGDISTTTTVSTFTPASNIPYDTIYWKIRAVDRAGNISAYSTEWHFDLVNNAPSQPGTIVISGVTSNSATMSWGASTDSDGDAITYEVEYGINNTLSWTSGGSTASTSRGLSGLAPLQPMWCASEPMTARAELAVGVNLTPPSRLVP